MAARDPAELDRLIEEGLSRYGKGDLDGALHAWELALSTDPENAQANSYVDYVRMNYELLVEGGAVETSAAQVPFGIAEDEPEYLVEIQPGERIVASTTAPVLADVDEGWFIDEELSSPSPLVVTIRNTQTSQPIIELEAELPPDGVNFDDATHEYRPDQKKRQTGEFERPQLTPEFGTRQDLETPPFGSSSDLRTPTEFNLELTNVRKRDLGFVKPRETAESPPLAKAPAEQDADPVPEEAPTIARPAVEPRPRRPSVVPELKMTLRTPEIPDRDPCDDEAAADDLVLDRTVSHLDATVSPLDSTVSQLDTTVSMKADALKAVLSVKAEVDEEPYGSIELSEQPTQPRTPLAVDRVDDVRAPSPNPPDPDAEEPDLFGGETKDLPDRAVLAAADLGLAKAATRELPTAERRPAKVSEPPVASAPTRDFSQPPMSSAPTRDLGLRPTRAPTEDEPTKQTDVRAFRDHTAAAGAVADVVHDPVAARAAQILDEVDDGASTTETKEDRTRRRIQGLMERATEWNRTGDCEKAAIAIELALSEDATSPLAQKLLHRNRDTVTTVFQGYLGDLQRQPVLSRPLHELGLDGGTSMPISSRAAFLLSRIDGVLSLDEILDVSGMPRLEAYRYLCQLFLRGILR